MDFAESGRCAPDNRAIHAIRVRMMYEKSVNHFKAAIRNQCLRDADTFRSLVVFQ